MDNAGGLDRLHIKATEEYFAWLINFVIRVQRNEKACPNINQHNNCGDNGALDEAAMAMVELFEHGCYYCKLINVLDQETDPWLHPYVPPQKAQHQPSLMS